MCGIAGIVARDVETVRRSLRAMTDAQRHRGPDDQGETVVELGHCAMGLGHRRLSILDLSPAGHEPMVHPATGDLLVYNGEIYNFQILRQELESEGTHLTGHSDAEVLLHGLARHGPSYVTRLEGMFAFAYFNMKERTLLLARDPLGIKPLYVAFPAGGLLFASEARAVMASGMMPRRIDPLAVTGLLAYGAVQEPGTVFQGVSSFPPGCRQVFELGRPNAGFVLQPERHWSFPPADRSATIERAVDDVRQTLDAAVRDHLVSDVPVGVFLSSGLDSTLVASLAARHARGLRTFTVGFADQAELSEQSLAIETARRIGAEHTAIQLTQDDARSAVEKWIDTLDQPSVDGLNTWLISRAVRAQGIIVALSGLGGDELFGGYSNFVSVPRAARLLRRARWAPRWSRRAVAAVATVGRPPAVRTKALDMASTEGELTALYLRRRRALADDELRAMGLIPEALDGGPGSPLYESIADVEVAGDLIAAVSRLEARLYMGNTLLRDGDANGMAHGLEIRVPMLDRRLIDRAFALPGRIRLPSYYADKHLLRAAFADLLPSKLLQQKKRGFTLPVGHWMAGPLRPMCEEGLTHLKSLGLLREKAIDEVSRDYLAGSDRRRWARPFALCVLGLYCRKMNL